MPDDELWPEALDDESIPVGPPETGGPTFIACCDCGLVHRIYADHETVIRMRQDERLTTEQRRAMKRRTRRGG